MKTRIAIITMLLSIFIAGSAFAGEPVPSPKALATKAVANYLSDELSYPAFASETNLECTVLVNLIIKSDGTLDVEAANCKSTCVKDYAVKEIEKVKDDVLAQHAGQNVMLKIDFKLLK
jgi:hypothetical protein